MAPTHLIRALVAIAVVAHLVVNVLHGQAHMSLSVGLSPWQQVFVYVVILLMPLVALALVFTRHSRLALWLLLVSMLGSFIFGGVYHYIVISPDHVAHLPPGDARGIFRVTALLLLVTEAFGVLVAGIGIRGSRRRP
jgi:hypothetical protein